MLCIKVGWFMACWQKARRRWPPWSGWLRIFRIRVLLWMPILSVLRNIWWWAEVMKRNSITAISCRNFQITPKPIARILRWVGSIITTISWAMRWRFIVSYTTTIRAHQKRKRPTIWFVRSILSRAMQSRMCDGRRIAAEYRTTTKIVWCMKQVTMPTRKASLLWLRKVLMLICLTIPRALSICRPIITWPKPTKSWRIQQKPSNIIRWLLWPIAENWRKMQPWLCWSWVVKIQLAIRFWFT